MKTNHSEGSRHRLGWKWPKTAVILTLLPLRLLALEGRAASGSFRDAEERGVTSARVQASPPPPALDFSPSTNGAYDFGSVNVGQTAQQTFTLLNSGGSASGALGVTLLGSTAFTKIADTCTAVSIGPNKTCGVTVEYAPIAAGQADIATLSASGKKAGAGATLTLTGSGAAIRHIYWAQTLSATIGRADLDGSHENPSFIVLPAGSLPHDVVVAAGHIYWTLPFSGTIGRADLDGQNVNPSFITGLSGCCDGIAADNGHIYWTGGFSGTVGRADLDGQNVNASLITGLFLPDGIAVDSGHIYWANFFTGSIGRADLDGQNVNELFITGGNAADVVVDSGHVYWSNSVSVGSIGRADLDGQNVTPGFIMGASSPRGVAIDSSHIYWANAESLGRADRDGQNVNQSFLGGVSAIGVAVDPN